LRGRSRATDEAILVKGKAKLLRFAEIASSSAETAGLLAMTETFMNYLGIDYGEKRIGLAIADNACKTAVAFDTLVRENQEKWPRNAVLRIDKICKQEKIKKIIVGLPIALSGRSTDQTNKTQEFIDLLEKQTGLPVKAGDERFTTRMANLAGVAKNKRDQSAAVLILQSWIEKC